MKIEFSDEQLALLKEILAEYRDGCYQSIFDLQRAATEAEDQQISQEYTSLAVSEEGHFFKVKELLEYIERYEELMKGR